MFAKIAAVLFLIALLIELLPVDSNKYINATTLTTAGLIFVALQLSGWGFRGNWRGRRR